MGTQTRIALVGAGTIGGRQAAAISQLERAEFAAVCDVNLERAEALAEEFGVPRAESDLATLLKSGEIDAVTVASNHGAHGQNLFDAAAAGVHAIVEKPLSTRLSEAYEMVEAAQEAGIKFGAIFQRRFFPAAQNMKCAITDGRIGAVTAGEVVSHLGRDRAYYERDEWRGSWAAEGGGALMTQAIHMLDMLMWMLGKPTEVYGRWATLKHSEYIEVEDTAVATIAFESGALASVTALNTLDPAYGFSLAVHGTTGDTLSLKEWPELTEAKIDQWTLPDGGPTDTERQAPPRPGFPEFHRLQLQDFVDAIQNDREPAVTGVEGRDALGLTKAIYLADKRRSPVRFPLTADDITEAE